MSGREQRQFRDAVPSWPVLQEWNRAPRRKLHVLGRVLLSGGLFRCGRRHLPVGLQLWWPHRATRRVHLQRWLLLCRGVRRKLQHLPRGVVLSRGVFAVGAVLDGHVRFIDGPLKSGLLGYLQRLVGVLLRLRLNRHRDDLSDWIFLHWGCRATHVLQL